MMDSKLARTEDLVILSLQLLSLKLFASLLKSLLLISNWKFPREVAWRDLSEHAAVNSAL